MQKLRLLLSANRLYGIKVGSVEEFQGQERRVIIVSTVRSSDEHLESDAAHALGFVRSPKRFNVAVTRAKALLVVVGNPHVLRLDPCWRALLESARRVGAYRGCALRDESDIDDTLSAAIVRLKLNRTDEPHGDEPAQDGMREGEHAARRAQPPAPAHGGARHVGGAGGGSHGALADGGKLRALLSGLAPSRDEKTHLELVDPQALRAIIAAAYTDPRGAPYCRTLDKLSEALARCHPQSQGWIDARGFCTAGIGRFHAREPSVQHLPRALRTFLCRTVAVQVDFEACGPTICAALCGALGLDESRTPQLLGLVHNRDGWLAAARCDKRALFRAFNTPVMTSHDTSCAPSLRALGAELLALDAAFFANALSHAVGAACVRRATPAAVRALAVEAIEASALEVLIGAFEARGSRCVGRIFDCAHFASHSVHRTELDMSALASVASDVVVDVTGVRLRARVVPFHDVTDAHGRRCESAQAAAAAGVLFPSGGDGDAELPFAPSVPPALSDVDPAGVFASAREDGDDGASDDDGVVVYMSERQLQEQPEWRTER